MAQIGLININNNFNFNINFNIEGNFNINVTTVSFDDIKSVTQKGKTQQVVALIGLFGTGKSRMSELLCGRDGQWSNDRYDGTTKGFRLINIANSRKDVKVLSSEESKYIELKNNNTILVDSQGLGDDSMSYRMLLKMLKELDKTIGGIDKIVLTIPYARKFTPSEIECFVGLRKYIEPWSKVVIMFTFYKGADLKFDPYKDTFISSIRVDFRSEDNHIGVIDMPKKGEAAYSDDRIKCSIGVIKEMIDLPFEDTYYKIDYPACTLL